MLKATPQRRLGSWIKADDVRFEEGSSSRAVERTAGRSHRGGVRQRLSHVGDRFPAEAVDLHAAITPYQIGES
jgi:hypothetical protein